METQNGPYKDYSPSKTGVIWVSMLVWGSVCTVMGQPTVGWPRSSRDAWRFRV